MLRTIDRSHIALAFSVAACVVAVANPALAQVAGLGATERAAEVDTDERPFLLSLGIGPTVVFSNTLTRCADPFSPCTSQTGTGFLVSLDVGGHLARVDEHPGLFLAGSAAFTPGPVFGGRFGARLGFDIQIARFEDPDVSLLVTPSILAGIALADQLGFLVALEVAGDVRVVLLDGHLGIWVRPIGSDMQFLQYFTWRWDFLAGAELRL